MEYIELERLKEVAIFNEHSPFLYIKCFTLDPDLYIWIHGLRSFQLFLLKLF